MNVLSSLKHRNLATTVMKMHKAGSQDAGQTGFQRACLDGLEELIGQHGTDMSAPPPFEQIPLAFLYRTGRMFEAECLSCGARQSLNFPMLMKQSGMTACLADIASDVPCFFCKKPGVKVFEISVGR